MRRCYSGGCPVPECYGDVMDPQTGAWECRVWPQWDEYDCERCRGEVVEDEEGEG